MLVNLYSDGMWSSWCPKSLATQLFDIQFVQAKDKDDIKAPRKGISPTKGQ